VLDPIRRLRPATVDKREFGHLFVVGGSAYMPGALLMAVQAAVRSGAGLVTAFAPASVAASLAAQVPEAMWIPWPGTSNGTLRPRAMPLLLERINQASAVLVGPGMGKDRNTEMVVQEIIRAVECPIVLDADALRTRILEAAQKRRAHFGRIVITPHMGEFMRIAKLSQPDYTVETLRDFCRTYSVVTVLKAAITRICDGETVLYNTQGGPVLSRGGSGDLLAGLIGGILAQNNACVPTAVARGVLLHGKAAQHLARTKGQVAVRTTELLDYLPVALRS
jgi:NAD(P)H-hydrate epimerase